MRLRPLSLTTALGIVLLFGSGVQYGRVHYGHGGSMWIVFALDLIGVLLIAVEVTWKR